MSPALGITSRPRLEEKTVISERKKKKRKKTEWELEYDWSTYIDPLATQIATATNASGVNLTQHIYYKKKCTQSNETGLYTSTSTTLHKDRHDHSSVQILVSYPKQQAPFIHPAQPAAREPRKSSSRLTINIRVCGRQKKQPTPKGKEKEYKREAENERTPTQVTSNDKKRKRAFHTPHALRQH